MPGRRRRPAVLLLSSHGFHSSHMYHMDHTADTGSSVTRRVAGLVVAALVTTVLLAGRPLFAQESIDDAERQRDDARDSQLDAEVRIELLEAYDEDVVAALAAATELVERQRARVEAARLELEQARTEQRQIEIALQWSALDLETLRDEARVVAVEAYLSSDERRRTEFVLSAEDANDAATRLAMLDAVSDSATEVLEQLRVAADEHDAALAAVDEVVARVARIESELETELAELEESEARQAEIKAELDARIADWEAQLAEFEAEEQRLTQFIIDKQAEQAAARAAAAAAAAAGGGSGAVVPDLSAVSTQGFVYPTAGGISSGFGQRLHPILGYYRMHTGLDMGGGFGSPIWAAKGGTVIAAGWNGGYGNAVIIDHGGGVATLYAHQSELLVSVGQVVEAGQRIGSVGSTGLSTGPHLHFEVRVGGNPVDPLLFLP